MIPGQSLSETSAPAGIYVHVPFCLAKCSYCDFYSITDLKRITDYLEALLLEIQRCQIVLPTVDTVYFGGGTPSTMSPRQIEDILDGLCKRFPLDPDAEITLEMNPGTADRKKLSGYRAAGISRLNIGLQSLSDQTLQWLGRIHDVRQGMDTFRWARKSGFDNIGLDLIYGVPGQTEKTWALELTAAVDMGAEHLSCYTLTLEPGTPLSVDVEKGRITPLDEALTGALFSFTSAFLSRHGYRQYEVSNYARVSVSVDYRSRHNRKYWTFTPYLGFGPAAHSFMDNRRWWNHRPIDAYLGAINAGRSPIAETETLTPEQQIMEYIYLGLRQATGIDTLDFESRFDLNFYRWYEHEISFLLNDDLLEIHHQWIRTTPLGMRFLDQVVDRLLG